MEKREAALRAQAAVEAAKPRFLQQQGAADTLNKEADKVAAQMEKHAEYLRGQATEAPEVKAARQSGYPSPLQQKAAEEVQKADIARSEKVYSGIKGSADQYEKDTKPYLELSRSLLNNPDLYTGIGANRVLDWNRVKAMFGDTRAAEMQEALGKVTASTVLGTINMQKDQMAEAGQNSGRIFAQQVDLVQKAAPQLGTTLAGNRFLVEVQTRMGEQAKTVAAMARDYIRTNKYLDTGFDEKVSAYLEKHPLFNKQELAHVELLGAPSIPPGLRGAELQAWLERMNLDPNEAVRRSDGTYAHPVVNIPRRPNPGERH